MFENIVVKIGSNVLTNADGTLNTTRIEHFVDQIASLTNKKRKITLISSGAVASGRSMVKVSKKLDPVSARQLLSSVGQVKLINTYSQIFDKHSMKCAQILVTKEDFRTREHYLNMKNCIQTLHDNHIVPIINENDAVSVTALMFTDNDELAGLIATMMDADALFILSNIDGIYNGNPSEPGSEVIKIVESQKSDLSQYISTTKSNFGRGGMLTKCRIATKTAESGISVHIANGTRENIITDLATHPQKVLHTHFVPGEHHAAVKKWMAYSEGFTKAEVTINAGAVKALLSNKASSLLPPGIISLTGDFEKGDLIKIKDEAGNTLGIGRAQTSKEKLEISNTEKKSKPFIHYDYLYLFPEVPKQ
ncbi:MAG: glutamate 5-kinase [Breznakibacter sp.]|nr:glutamate 5-kinase [Breznakibacter sp.]